jgi:hypothetical protein
LGEENIRTASVLTALAISRSAQGDFDEADQLCRKAMRIVEKVAGPDSLYWAFTLTEYARVLRRKKEYPRADEMEKMAKAAAARARAAISSRTVDFRDLK